jgi:S-adenosylhomocysteine hydrolase
LRPIAEIPPQFFDVPANLDERLALLEAWLSEHAGAAPLAGCTLLLVQHQLANHAAQADGLVRLGADPDRIHWVDIPYTSQAALRSYLTSRLAIPGANLSVSDDYQVLDSYAPYQHQRVVRAVLTLAGRSAGPLLVLDDGAYVLEALASLKPARWPGHVAIVEQTTRGLIKLRESFALAAAATRLPFINVAESAPKRTLEPPFIAMSVCVSLERKLRPRLAGRRLGRCLVLGYGAIGEQVASYLALQFGVGRDDILVHDTVPGRNQVASRRGFAIWDRSDSEQTFELVVGCSGRASFQIGDFPFLADGALLASASSGAVELSRAEFIELADASREDDIRIVREKIPPGDLHADLEFELVDRTATFLNAGFPINFDGRLATTPGRYIQPTPVMMCGAAVQARRALDEGRTGIIDLDGRLSDWLDRSFREVLGPDAHMLVPPPDEAW